MVIKRDWVKHLSNLVSISLLIYILVGLSSFIFEEQNTMIHFLTIIFSIIFYSSASIFWIAMMIHSARLKRWNWLTTIFLLWLLGAIIYYSKLYNLSNSRVLNKAEKRTTNQIKTSILLGIWVGVLISIGVILYCFLPIILDGNTSERFIVLTIGLTALMVVIGFVITFFYKTLFNSILTSTHQSRFSMQTFPLPSACLSTHLHY